GAGGIGAVVAYGIHYTGKSNLGIVVRGHYDKLISEGYTIDSVDYGKVDGWKPDYLYPSIEEAGKSGIEYDFVVVSTKNLPDIEKVEDLIEPVVTPSKTAVVLVQNGFDIGRPLIERFPQNIIISGVSHCGSHKYGTLVEHIQHDNAKISYFGNPNFEESALEQKTKEFISMYKNPKNDIDYFPNERWYRYRKLVYNATLNT
ncbi:hypothetical protein WICPIJ_005041, partial [Wickerhamomyces pijperi]